MSEKLDGVRAYWDGRYGHLRYFGYMQCRNVVKIAKIIKCVTHLYKTFSLQEILL